MDTPIIATVEQTPVRFLPDGRADRKNTARYLGVKEKTLAMWQLQGKGPRSVLVGGRRFYYRSDLDEWVASECRRPPRRRRGTSEADAIAL